jgi:hypothetical protein
MGEKKEEVAVIIFKSGGGNTVLRCAAPYLASLSDGEESLQAVNALV